MAKEIEEKFSRMSYMFNKEYKEYWDAKEKLKQVKKKTEHLTKMAEVIQNIENEKKKAEQINNNSVNTNIPIPTGFDEEFQVNNKIIRNMFYELENLDRRLMKLENAKVKKNVE